MSTIFCSECGAKNEYSVSKPKFCQGCGDKMGNFTSSASREPNGDAVHDSEEVPSIDKLEYEIEVAGTSKVTLENVLNNPLNPSEVSRAEDVQGYRKKTHREFTKESMAECGSSKGKPTEIN